MRVKFATKQQMKAALAQVNKRYGNNIAFYADKTEDGLYPEGQYISFRLAIKSYDKPGWRYSFAGRKMKFACWHVHGEFFDALLNLVPEAVIYTAGKKIFRAGYTVYGNWEDWNVGSMVEPLSFSAACAGVEGHPKPLEGELCHLNSIKD